MRVYTFSIQNLNPSLIIFGIIMIVNLIGNISWTKDNIDYSIENISSYQRIHRVPPNYWAEDLPTPTLVEKVKIQHLNKKSLQFAPSTIKSGESILFWKASEINSTHTMVVVGREDKEAQYVTIHRHYLVKNKLAQADDDEWMIKYREQGEDYTIGWESQKEDVIEGIFEQAKTEGDCVTISYTHLESETKKTNHLKSFCEKETIDWFKSEDIDVSPMAFSLNRNTKCMYVSFEHQHPRQLRVYCAPTFESHLINESEAHQNVYGSIVFLEHTSMPDAGDEKPYLMKGTVTPSQHPESKTSSHRLTVNRRLYNDHLPSHFKQEVSLHATYENIGILTSLPAVKRYYPNSVVLQKKNTLLFDRPSSLLVRQLNTTPGIEEFQSDLKRDVYLWHHQSHFHNEAHRLEPPGYHLDLDETGRMISYQYEYAVGIMNTVGDGLFYITSPLRKIHGIQYGQQVNMVLWLGSKLLVFFDQQIILYETGSSSSILLYDMLHYFTSNMSPLKQTVLALVACLYIYMELQRAIRLCVRRRQATILNTSSTPPTTTTNSHPTTVREERETHDQPLSNNDESFTVQMSESDDDDVS